MKLKKSFEARAKFPASEVIMSKSYILPSRLDLKGGIHFKLHKLDLWLENVFPSKSK